LTITINNENVSFNLGIGLIGKSFKISDIKSCKPVRNSFIYGIGIHMLPNGWLYNVTGLKAIELQLNNKKTVVRIGTNKPEEISEIIQALIGKNVTEGIKNLENKRQNRPIWIIISFALIVLLIPMALIFSGNRGTDAQVDNRGLIIRGTYGLTIPLNEIIHVDTISSLPRITMRNNGYAFQKTRIGNFRTADRAQVKLYVKIGIKPYIVITSKDRVPIYLNFDDKQRTIKLYEDLKHEK